jgi:hypothetical protein
VNRTYRQNIKSFVGKVDGPDLPGFKRELEKQLNSKFPEGKAVLINYFQKAPNCITMKFKAEDALRVVNNSIFLSTKMCEKWNAVDYFVFSEDAYFKDLYHQQLHFHPDSGFFYNNIFTLQDVCRGFFILKPNGDFMKYYGEDYYSVVEEFLKKE